MTASATLVLANHRPETIPLACRLMTAHDTIPIPFGTNSGGGCHILWSAFFYCFFS
jgi:hypothetical protein